MGDATHTYKRTKGEYSLKGTAIFAHRGSKGNRPENTLAAFREAISLGVDGIELDVHMTSDNELVVIHDETVDRTTNGSGYIKDLSLQELKKLDAGSWFSDEYKGEKIPTLEEVFELLKDTKITLNIELKNDVFDYDGIENKVIQEVGKFSYYQNVILSSFNHYSIKKCVDINPGIDTALLFMEALYEPWNYANLVGAKAIHVYEPVALYYIKKEQTNRIPIRPFTVNDDEKLEFLIRNKIDAIFTDFPEKALNIRKKL